jgi:hypothetical protein
MHLEFAVPVAALWRDAASLVLIAAAPRSFGPAWLVKNARKMPSLLEQKATCLLRIESQV